METIKNSIGEEYINHSAQDIQGTEGWVSQKSKVLNLHIKLLLSFIYFLIIGSTCYNPYLNKKNLDYLLHH